MFGDILTLTDTALITFLGMGVVFLVLILLTMILSLFRFIPVNNITIISTSIEKSTDISPAYFSVVSSLHKAIIIATILESLEITTKKTQVRITSIHKISC
ncbi:MAG: OadG family protein [Spirochaetota bacterium]|nr:OadG family protein [Spirochaetota bacterium]